MQIFYFFFYSPACPNAILLHASRAESARDPYTFFAPNPQLQRCSRGKRIVRSFPLSLPTAAGKAGNRAIFLTCAGYNEMTWEAEGWLCETHKSTHPPGCYGLRAGPLLQPIWNLFDSSDMAIPLPSTPLVLPPARRGRTHAAKRWEGIREALSVFPSSRLRFLLPL